MAIMSRETSNGVEYYSSETGRKIKNEVIEQRLAEKKAKPGLAARVGSFISGAVDTATEAAGSALDSVRDYNAQQREKAKTGEGDLSQLNALWNANAWNQTNADKAAQLAEAASVLGVSDSEKRGLMQAGLGNDDIAKMALNRARQQELMPDDWAEFEAKNPKTTKYLSDQKNMAQSWDDMKGLSFLEETVTSIQEHMELTDIDERRKEIGKALWDNGELSAAELAELDSLNARRQELGEKYSDAWDFDNVVGGIVGGMASDVLFGLKAGAAAGTAAAGATAITGPGALAAGLAGFGYGMVGGMAYAGATRATYNFFLENAMRESKDGQTMGASLNNKVTSTLYGMGMGALFSGAGGRILSRMPGAGELVAKFTKAMPENVAENPAVEKAAWETFLSHLGRFAKSTGEQAVIMGGATKATELAARATAEEFSGLDYDHSNEPSAWAQIAQSTIDFIPTGMAFSALPVAANAMVQRRTNVPTAGDAIGQMADALKESKTFQRSEEAGIEALQANLKDTGAEYASMSAKDFTAHFQTLDDGSPVSPAEALRRAQEAAEALGITPEALKRAYDSGDEITFKTSDFIKTYMKSPEFEGMKDEISFSTRMISKKQAQEIREEIERFNKDVQAAVKDETIDKDSPAFQAAVRLARLAYPDENNAGIEAQAKLTYFLAKRAEDRGVLKALGYKSAEDALNVEVRRRESFGQLQGEVGIENPIAAQGEAKGVYLSSEEAQPIIGIFKTADRSTLPHEIMHHTLDLYRKAVETGKVSEEVAADWKTLLDYAGVKEGEKMSIEQEEKLTSAFERYLAEGKAPSLELVSVFAKFKRWLKNVYGKLIGAGETVNPQVREVFDRMLAADEALEQAEVFYNSEHLMSAKELGLTELKQFAQLLDKANAEKDSIMAKRIAKELQPEVQQEIARVRAALKAEESAKLAQEPVYVARALMSAPANVKDVQKAQAEYRQRRLDEEVRSLVLESKLGTENDHINPDEMTSGAAREFGLDYNDEASAFYGDQSLNMDWYRDMLDRLGGKLPAAWSKYIDKVKAGDESAKMPPKMRAEYEYIAEQRLKEGFYESSYGDVPPDSEFLILTSDSPGAEFVRANGGGLKLNRESTEAQYGKGVIPESWMTKDGKFTLDDVAEVTGFSSGDALRQEILSRPTFAQAVNKNVAARLAEWKDEHLGSIKETAAEAVLNERSLEAIGVEIEALVRRSRELKQANAAAGKAAEKAAKETRKLDAQVMRGSMRAKAAKAYAKEAIGKQAVGDLKDMSKYLYNSVKAGKQAVKAMERGDYDIAIEFKNQELVGRALALEARRAEKVLKVTYRFFDRVDKRGLDMKGVDHAYNLQIDRLLDKFNLLKKRSPIDPLDSAEDVDLHTFLDQMREDYHSVDEINQDLVNMGRTDYTRLSFDEIGDLKTAVKILQTAGRDTVTLLSGEKKSYKEMAQELVEQIGKHRERFKNIDEAGNPEKSVFDRLMEMPGQVVDCLVRNESLMRLIDEDTYGVAQKYIEAPIRDGERQFDVRNEKSMEAIKKIIKDAGLTEKEMATWRSNSTRRHFDFLPNDLTLEERICMAFNWGNEGNRDRLRYYFESRDQRKRHSSLTDAELAEIDRKVMHVLGTLDKRHWDFVQGMWQYLDSYKDEIRRHELDCSGTDVKMVEATPFSLVTEKGDLVEASGGYYPIKYDPQKSRKAYKQEELNALYKQSSAVAATTEHGHTKNRVNHNGRPLLLSLRGLSEHITNLNYDLSMRRAIIDVRRILNNSDFAHAIESRFGVEALRNMEEWLKYVASDQREAMTGIDRFIKESRMRMSVATMGFRAKALIEDLPGNFVTACWQLGINETMKAVGEFYRNPTELKAFVDSKSPMMASKMKFLDRDIQDFASRVFEPKGTVGKAVQNIGRYSFIFDQVADSLVNYPLWNHIYKRETAKGATEREAVERADAFIRRTSIDPGRAGTVGAVRKAGEKGKAMTMFYSWYSGLFNRYWTTAQLARHYYETGDTAQAAKTFIHGAVMGYTIPAIWAGIITAVTLNDRKKDKKAHEKAMEKAFASGFVGYASGTVPVFGRLGAYAFDKALGGYYASFDLSPVEGFFRRFGDAGAEIKKFAESPKKDEDIRRVATKTAEATAYLTPFPVRPVTIVNNMIDWMDENGDLSIADFISKRKYK